MVIGMARDPDVNDAINQPSNAQPESILITLYAYLTSSPCPQPPCPVTSFWAQGSATSVFLLHWTCINISPHDAPLDCGF